MTNGKICTRQIRCKKSQQVWWKQKSQHTEAVGNGPMQFCDNHPGVVQWAREAVKIPIKIPLTNRNTIYVPDFLVVYSDKKGNRHAEVIEVKSKKETDIKSAGRNLYTG